MSTLRAPFPYPGGKSRIAPLVWQYLDGDGAVGHYVEPFLGSAAVLLARPNPRVWETVNDADGLLTNAWRGIRECPDEVAARATELYQSELDRHARHAWLQSNRMRITDGLRADPEWCDAKAAAWWIWGMANWIGHGFGWTMGGKLPQISPCGKGILRNPNPAPTYGAVGSEAAPPPREWVALLSERLKRVRIASGDWARVVTPAVLWNPATLGPTAVFLDPPYNDCEGYGSEVKGVADDVAKWCLENGDNPRLRIALCGHSGDYDMPGWRQEIWRRKGGGRGDGSARANPECVWFSPHCVGARQQSLW